MNISPQLAVSNYAQLCVKGRADIDVERMLARELLAL